jgi:RimJ/RimL family protein N-acetyltransferase
MEVRPASFADVAAIASGMRAVADEGRWIATEAGTPIEELAKRIRRWLAENPVSLVLIDAEALVGALDLHETRVEGVLSLGMWVLASHRGRGGGRLLLEAAVAARPDAVHKIELEVWPDNEGAIALYRSLGFDEEGLRRDHYRREDGSLRSALIMARLFE